MNQQMYRIEEDDDDKKSISDTIREAEQTLKPKDTIDLLISGDVELEDVIGFTIPDRQFTVASDIKTQRKRMDGIKAKYVKAPDEVDVEETKGAYSRFKEFVFGAKKETIIEGAAGPITIGLETYTRIKNDVDVIKNTMPEIMSGLASLESYVLKKEEENSRLSETFLSLGETFERAKKTYDDLESRLDDKSASPKEKFKIYELKNKVNRYTSNIRSHQASIGNKMAIYSEQIELYGRDLTIAKANFDNMQIDINGLDAMLEGIKTSLEFQEIKGPMIENSAKMKEYRIKLRDLYVDIQGYSRESTELLAEGLNSGLGFGLFSASEHRDMASKENEYISKINEDAENIIRKTEALIIKKNESN